MVRIMKTFLFLCMRITLFDQDDIRQNLLPFTYTRPVSDIRVGILTIAEKWQNHGFDISFDTADYLNKKYPSGNNSIRVNGALCPTSQLVEAVNALKEGEKLVYQGLTCAEHGHGENEIGFKGDCLFIEHTWDIFLNNGAQIRSDFDLLTEGRSSQSINDEHSIVYGKENLFIEEGARIKAAIINAEDGPVYIGKNARVHEGSLIKGPFALCEESHVNMGAKIKGDTTVGPYSKVGGEISNSVIFGYSNKGHDGFLGNSVIGEWCNLGADTNTSNLKNNYATVKLWNYGRGGFDNTGLQFCGLMMGDHAKCGINTMFNTGTLVGVGANVFGSGFPRNFVPSFSWGGAAGFSTFQPRKFYEVAEAVMKRRGKEFDEMEKEIIDHIFDSSTAYRIWDKK